jgi:hypothetical protein
MDAMVDRALSRVNLGIEAAHRCPHLAGGLAAAPVGGQATVLRGVPTTTVGARGAGVIRGKRGRTA